MKIPRFIHSSISIKKKTKETEALGINHLSQNEQFQLLNIVIFSAYLTQNEQIEFYSNFTVSLRLFNLKLGFTAQTVKHLKAKLRMNMHINHNESIPMGLGINSDRNQTLIRSGLQKLQSLKVPIT